MDPDTTREPDDGQVLAETRQGGKLIAVDWDDIERRTIAEALLFEQTTGRPPQVLVITGTRSERTLLLAEVLRANRCDVIVAHPLDDDDRLHVRGFDPPMMLVDDIEVFRDSLRSIEEHALLRAFEGVGVGKALLALPEIAQQTADKVRRMEMSTAGFAATYGDRSWDQPASVDIRTPQRFDTPGERPTRASRRGQRGNERHRRDFDSRGRRR